MNMIRKKRKSNKYVFILKNINTEQIDKKYGITIISNITQTQLQPHNTTKLTELKEINLEKTLETISFFDEAKRIYQCNISMIDFSTGKDLSLLNYNCYWCRHPFNSYPIGCPIKYLSNKSIKSYHSEVSKDNYVIKENITKSKTDFFEKNKSDNSFDFSIIKDTKKSNIIIHKESYYETDGVFCSFNCCKSYIKDNKHNIMYNYSETLLIKLLTEITNNNNKDVSLKSIVINPAPSWRLLSEYGGHLSINEFRENFNKITYDFHGLFKPVAHVYEEKINF